MPSPKKNKYALYELSVQSPEWHLDWFDRVFELLRGRKPRSLREDFCGTGRLSADWARHRKDNVALGLDLDPEPLAYGRANHQSPRTELRKQDVLLATRERWDLIAACNFSVNIFKTRALLLRYFRSSLRSLNKEGLLLLEVAGGPGMIGKIRERKTVRAPGLGLPGGKFVYVWDQKEFDPITHHALYAIHFQFSDRSQMRDAFVYDWRLWTLPELREAMLEAGFSEVKIFWETEHRGEGTGEYLEASSGDNAFSWIAYVVGAK